MKKLLLLAISIALFACSSGSKFTYKSVDGDPLKARIYTLDNGLKVYMSVNEEAPRVQTIISFKVGGKNDPATTTGLAHYLEHLMFKGTKQFGTQNYEAEKPLLDQIEQQFEIYRNTTDSVQRVAIYHIIDSLSYEASKFSIPNEYDKLMAAIGSNGSNAWTSKDETSYMEDIPSNQIENWAKIQADRFKNNVIRGFHTELETVYEEKNMSLTNDNNKSFESLNTALFSNHPYGLQTVLGTQEHLKNPSIINIKNYYGQWYVPNNMAICVSGDFNPDSMIVIIDRYFGDMVPNENLHKIKFEAEQPITSPVKREVYGLEAENLWMGYRFAGANSDDVIMLEVINGLLNNGKSGLIDLNVNQKQRVHSLDAFISSMSDYSVFGFSATPKQGQTLDQVKEIVIEQIDSLKKGVFDEKLMTAVVNNYKLKDTQGVEDNFNRAYSFVQSFIYDVPWEQQVKKVEKMSKITKQQVVDFTNANFKDNYAIVYKRQGKDSNESKINKPKITPIFTNRDTTSQFLRTIQASEVAPIEPVFLDYTKDMQVTKTATNNIPILYKQNTTNDIFILAYIIDYGGMHDKNISIAAQYLDFLGTSKYTPEQVQQKLYELACNMRVSVGINKTMIILSGLSENQSQAMELMEDIFSDSQTNEDALANMKIDILKQREDTKHNQRACFTALQNYAIWGPNSPFNNVSSNATVESLTSQELINAVKSLFAYDHKVLYYGPKAVADIVSDVEKNHKVPSVLKAADMNSPFNYQITKESKVLLAPYDAAQIYYIQYASRGDKFDPSRTPVNTLYNDYFGSGMNSIVFQEMREARGLAYSAQATMTSPSKKSNPYYMTAFIATQNDKMVEAIDAFEQIIVNMPESEEAFKIAKDGLLSRLRSERVIKFDVLNSYLQSQELGLNNDTRKELFDAVQKMTLADVIKYQQQYVKDNKWTFAVLGREKDLDMVSLAKYGKIERVTLKDIFGY